MLCLPLEVKAVKNLASLIKSSLFSKFALERYVIIRFMRVQQVSPIPKHALNLVQL